MIAEIGNVVKRTLSDPTSGQQREYFVGVLTSDIAKDMTFVPVVEYSSKTYLNEEIAEGYQRPAVAYRMRAFARYLLNNPLSVVPPVILSGRTSWEFDEEAGVLRVSSRAAIIDGQHRLGGFVARYEEDEVPRPIEFVLLPDLPLDMEKSEFLTVNNNQKGVIPSLTAYVEGSEDALIGQELNNREDSPLVGRITIATKKPGEHFTLAAMVKNVRRTFNHGAFSEVDIDQKIDILIRYWTLIADCYSDEWADLGQAPKDQMFKLLETTGLIAWSLAAEDILGPAFNPETKTMDWERVQIALRKLADTGCVDWSKTGEFQGLTGEVGGAKIHKKMQYCLQLDLDED